MQPSPAVCTPVETTRPLPARERGQSGGVLSLLAAAGLLFLSCLFIVYGLNESLCKKDHAGGPRRPPRGVIGAQPVVFLE